MPRYISNYYLFTGLSRSDWGCMAIVRIESAGPIGSALLHIH